MERTAPRSAPPRPAPPPQRGAARSGATRPAHRSLCACAPAAALAHCHLGGRAHAQCGAPQKPWAERFAGSPALFRETGREAGSGLGGDWPRVRLGGDRAGRERLGGDDWLRGGAVEEWAGRGGSGRGDWPRGGWGGAGGARACQCEGAAGSAAGRGTCGRCGATPRSGPAGGAPRRAAPFPTEGRPSRGRRAARGGGQRGRARGAWGGAGAGGAPYPAPGAAVRGAAGGLRASGASGACGGSRAAAACGRAAPFGGADRRRRTPAALPPAACPAPAAAAALRPRAVPLRAVRAGPPPGPGAAAGFLRADSRAASREVRRVRAERARSCGAERWDRRFPAERSGRSAREGSSAGTRRVAAMRGVPGAVRGGAAGEVWPGAVRAALRSGCGRVPVSALPRIAVAMNRRRRRFRRVAQERGGRCGLLCRHRRCSRRCRTSCRELRPRGLRVGPSRPLQRCGSVRSFHLCRVRQSCGLVWCSRFCRCELETPGRAAVSQ